MTTKTTATKAKPTTATATATAAPPPKLTKTTATRMVLADRGLDTQTLDVIRHLREDYGIDMTTTQAYTAVSQARKFLGDGKTTKGVTPKTPKTKPITPTQAEREWADKPKATNGTTTPKTAATPPKTANGTTTNGHHPVPSGGTTRRTGSFKVLNLGDADVEFRVPTVADRVIDGLTEYADKGLAVCPAYSLADIETVKSLTARLGVELVQRLADVLA